MKEKNTIVYGIPFPNKERKVELQRITPNGSIRVVFWGLRIYIVVMLILVVIGFSRGS